MNNNRCIFSYNDGSTNRCAFVEHFGISTVECNGLKDKQRCPFWAIADALSRIETSIQMLEGRE